MTGFAPKVRRELTKQLLSEPVFAEISHWVAAALTWLLLRHAVPAVPLLSWIAAIVAAATARGFIRRNAARRSPPPETTPWSVRAAVIATALAWGIGAALFIPGLELEDIALVLVIACGISAASTVTLVGDPVSFHGFLAALAIPLVAALPEGSSRGHTSYVMLIVLFVVIMLAVYWRMHSVLRRSIASEHATAASRAAIVEERRFLDQLVHGIPVALAVIDREERVVRINPAFERMFGFGPDEVLGSPLENTIVPPAERSRGASLARRVMETGTMTLETERVRADGRRVVVRISAANLEAAGMILVLYDDITERRLQERKAAAESAVMQSLEYVRTDQDMLPVVLIAAGHNLGWLAGAYWRIEDDGKVARCNLTWAADRETRDELFNRLRNTSLERTDVRGLLRRAWVDRSAAWCEDLGADGDALPPQYGTTRRSGAAAAAPILRGGEVIGILTLACEASQPRDAGILETISSIATLVGNTLDRVHAERALQEAENQYKQLVEAAADVVWRVDRDGMFTFVNDASRKVWGWPPGRLIGKSFMLLIDPETPYDPQHAFARLLEGEEIRNFEALHRRADGEKVSVSVTATPLRDPEGRVIGAQGIVRDIGTEVATRAAHIAAKDAAEQAVAAKSAFLANISHEIRTPLTGILGLAELLLSSPLPAEQRRSVELIAASGESLHRIINDLLDLSKIEAHQLEIEQTDFDLPAVVRSTASLLEPVATAKGVDLAVEIHPDTPHRVRGDSVRLGQILTNLIGNATKFTEHGRITVRVAPTSGDPSDLVQFTVRDTGIGIPAGAISRIFEPFRQADASTTRVYGGTGLGLSIARRLVDLMGGSLAVSSEVGVGSEFTFAVQLPAARSPSFAVTSSTVDQGLQRRLGRPDRSLRVLIAEDNPVNQEVAATMLRRRGHVVDLVGNGREAVDAVAERRYDVVLMDLQMPILDGIQATEEIRSRESSTHLPIVALTANALTGERERCLAVGMNDYLSKPFRPQQLIGVVEGVLDGAFGAPELYVPMAGVGPPVDVQGLHSELSASGVGDALETILRIFVDDAPGRAAAIEEAVSGGDIPGIVRAAHAFKSAAGTIRARELAKLLQGLEDAARNGGDVKGCAASIAAEFREVMNQLSPRT